MTITDRTKTQIFGIPEYKTPKCNVDTSKKPKSSIAGFDKAKVRSYFQEQAEKMKSIPASNKYVNIIEWGKGKSGRIKGGIFDKSKHVS